MSCSTDRPKPFIFRSYIYIEIISHLFCRPLITLATSANICAIDDLILALRKQMSQVKKPRTYHKTSGVCKIGFPRLHKTNVCTPRPLPPKNIGLFFKQKETKFNCKQSYKRSAKVILFQWLSRHIEQICLQHTSHLSNGLKSIPERVSKYCVYQICTEKPFLLLLVIGGLSKEFLPRVFTVCIY